MASTFPASHAAPVIVLAPDSFKGSLAAADVATAMGVGILRVLPQARLRLCPMADGGEGTLDAILAAGGAGAAGGGMAAAGDAAGGDGASAASAPLRVTFRVHGASGHPLDAIAGLLGNGTAVIEVAQVVGLTDAIATAVDVQARDTRGVGEMIARLLDRGCRTFMVGLGGSSTNDGGAGMLAALGMRFTDASGAALTPTPESLARLAHADASGLDARLAQCAITIMSDVNNPLTGERGATVVFGPQKGVVPAQVGALDATLGRYAARVEAALGRSLQDASGSGAAGGLGFALQMLGGTFRSGADVVAEIIGLDAALAGAAWAITGEGRSDAQTAMRKAPWVVAERGALARVPVALLSGALDATALPVLHAHFAGCFALPPGPATLAASLAHTPAWLADRAEAMARLRFG
jgi:glycerate kinase